MEDAQMVKGAPTKNFFIHMLTRDIAVNDAILDLLDNCLDGVMRKKRQPPAEDDFQYYQGYKAEIEITSNSFSIWDNCGGIPLETAINYAFRLGKPSENVIDNDLPTVGIYGIGMKRAIFKMGREARVYSKTNTDNFCVHISEEWLTNDNGEWDLPIAQENTILEEEGTRIHINKLTTEMEGYWGRKDDRDSFENTLREEIAYHYSFIIEKGFSIYVNGLKVEPNMVKLLFHDTTDERKIMPYLYQTSIEGVDVKIALGFYDSIMTDEEMDQENEGNRTSKDAGWTVICNDRVILYNNKDHLTGWGEAGVPRYHTQFIGIRGVVVFRCNDPIKLPMTTTKRGIDMSSPIYSEIRGRMREGLKIFTDYTNKWKGRTIEERQISSNVPTVDMKQLLQSHDKIEQRFSSLHFASRNGAYIVKPVLPTPSGNNLFRFIRYSKAEEDINTVSNFIYGEIRTELKPSEIGERCFDIMLEKAKEKNT